MATGTLTYGSIWFETPAETTLDSPDDTPVKAAGTTTTMKLEGFTHPVSNRLTYTGAVARDFEVKALFSMTKGGTGADTGSFYIAKDGNVIVASRINRYIATTSAEQGAAGVACHVTLDTNEYVELWMSTAGGDPVTVTAGVLSAKVLG